MKKEIFIFLACCLGALVVVGALLGMFSGSGSKGAQEQVVETEELTNEFSKALDTFFDDNNPKLRTSTDIVADAGIDYVVQESLVVVNTLIYTFKQVYTPENIDGSTVYAPYYFLLSISFAGDSDESIVLTFYDKDIDGTLDNVFLDGKAVDSDTVADWQQRYTDELDTAFVAIQ